MAHSYGRLTLCRRRFTNRSLGDVQNHTGAAAIFVNTCGGDQNPLPRRSVDLCRRSGHMLAAAVIEVLKQPLEPVSPGLRTAFEVVDLPYLKVVTRDDLHPLLRDTNAIRARWAARMLQKLDEGEKFAESYPYPLHAWRLGSEMLVIGIGAETVVDYALRFKKEFGLGTWVCGYTDDMIAYIRSRRVWRKGAMKGARISTNTAALPSAGPARSKTASPPPCMLWWRKCGDDDGLMPIRYHERSC